MLWSCDLRVFLYALVMWSASVCHSSDNGTVDCSCVWTLRIVWIITETVFCKYDTHAKCLHGSRLLCISGRAISVKLHPQKFLPQVVTQCAMFKRNCNRLYWLCMSVMGRIIGFPSSASWWNSVSALQKVFHCYGYSGETFRGSISLMW